MLLMPKYDIKLLSSQLTKNSSLRLRSLLELVLSDTWPSLMATGSPRLLWNRWQCSYFFSSYNLFPLSRSHFCSVLFSPPLRESLKESQQYCWDDGIFRYVWQGKALVSKIVRLASLRLCGFKSGTMHLKSTQCP